MREIGGYMEFERNSMSMLHEGAEALNSGRNCLAYLLKVKKIEKIAMPYFLCDSVKNLNELQGKVRFYHINENFLPVESELREDEWLYLVNYYGQLSREMIEKYKKKYKNIILDQAHAYFMPQIEGVDSIYICRKFFGVPDGAFLYTDKKEAIVLPQDESYMKMNFLLGRMERTASEFYKEYINNETLFENEPIKRMSKLTDNLLHGIDYQKAKERRNDNYKYLHEKLFKINHLKLHETEGAFAYPLWLEEGIKIREAVVRSELIANKIYIPVLWPNVIKDVQENDLEMQLTKNILPIPCDHRYNIEDMERIFSIIKNICRL